MRVLVACEFSGVVRDAFRDIGHDAVSCDIVPSERPGPHIQDDVRKHLDGWDLIIAHPPCTYLANSGVHWLYEGGKGTVRDANRWQLMEDGASFFRDMLNAPAPKVAVENPIMHGYAKAIVGKEQDQIIQPWQFGHGYTKATCLWLKELPMLVPTQMVEGRDLRMSNMAPGPNRQRERSRTPIGLAIAMAAQWGTEEK